MNIRQLVGAELVKLLTDAQESELGRGLKSFVDSEIENAFEFAKLELKAYVDKELAKLTNPAPVANQPSAPSA